VFVDRVRSGWPCPGPPTPKGYPVAETLVRLAPGSCFGQNGPLASNGLRILARSKPEKQSGE